MTYRLLLAAAILAAPACAEAADWAVDPA